MYVSDNYLLYFRATMYYVRRNCCPWCNPMVLVVGIIWVVCARKPACYIILSFKYLLLGYVNISREKIWAKPVIHILHDKLN